MRKLHFTRSAAFFMSCVLCVRVGALPVRSSPCQARAPLKNLRDFRLEQMERASVDDKNGG